MTSPLQSAGGSELPSMSRPDALQELLEAGRPTPRGVRIDDLGKSTLETAVLTEKGPLPGIVAQHAAGKVVEGAGAAGGAYIGGKVAEVICTEGSGCKEATVFVATAAGQQAGSYLFAKLLADLFMK